LNDAHKTAQTFHVNPVSHGAKQRKQTAFPIVGNVTNIAIYLCVFLIFPLFCFSCVMSCFFSLRDDMAPDFPLQPFEFCRKTTS
jgi:hypothetical protein